jgi:hypothetical protein
MPTQPSQRYSGDSGEPVLSDRERIALLEKQVKELLALKAQVEQLQTSILEMFAGSQLRSSSKR